MKSSLCHEASDPIFEMSGLGFGMLQFLGPESQSSVSTPRLGSNLFLELSSSPAGLETESLSKPRLQVRFQVVQNCGSSGGIKSPKSCHCLRVDWAGLITHIQRQRRPTAQGHRDERPKLVTDFVVTFCNLAMLDLVVGQGLGNMRDSSFTCLANIHKRSCHRPLSPLCSVVGPSAVQATAVSSSSFSSCAILSGQSETPTQPSLAQRSLLYMHWAFRLPCIILFSWQRRAWHERWACVQSDRSPVLPVTDKSKIAFLPYALPALQVLLRRRLSRRRTGSSVCR